MKVRRGAWAAALLLNAATVIAGGQTNGAGANTTERGVAGYLPPGAPDVAGYRRYNYILIREPIDAASRSATERVLDLVAKALAESRPAVTGRERNSLTIVYFLVRRPPPDDPNAAWLVEQYDYSRSKSLLAHIGAPPGAGPFLAVSKEPLLAEAARDHAFAQVFDLSASQRSALPSWMPLLPPPPWPSDDDEERSGAAHQLTGRDFLLPNAPEPPGFGLYSYVLFGEHANSANQDLYGAILAAYLALDEARRFESEHVDRKELNVTFVPLRQAAPDEVSVPWILDHYNYVAAQILLKKLVDDADISGTYIVSYEQPVSSTTEVDRRRLLVQDLTGLPPNLAFLWFREFKAQVRQSRYWDDKTMGQFMLKMRTQIALIARAFGGVRSPDGDMRSFAAAKIRMQR